MTDPISSPVSLPAGSFDVGALQKSLDKAAAGKAEAFNDAVVKAIDGAQDSVFKAQDARTIPGYEFQTVENKDLGIEETIQLYDPKLAEEQNVTGAIPEDEIVTTQAKTRARAVEAADSPKDS